MRVLARQTERFETPGPMPAVEAGSVGRAPLVGGDLAAVRHSFEDRRVGVVVVRTRRSPTSANGEEDGNNGSPDPKFRHRPHSSKLSATPTVTQASGGNRAPDDPNVEAPGRRVHAYPELPLTRRGVGGWGPRR